jgi:hypothetical protein
MLPVPHDYTISQDKALEIIDRHLPRGWSHREIKLPHAYGYCQYERRVIETHPISSGFMAGTFLHETAHAQFHVGKGELGYIEEFEAEVWAMRVMRAEKLRVSRLYLAIARRNVRRSIVEDHAKGFEINPHVLAWATKVENPQVTKLIEPYLKGPDPRANWWDDPLFVRSYVR